VADKPSSPQHAFLIAMLDVNAGIDPIEFNDWYNTEHMARRLACPGFVAGRRFRAIEGLPNYATMYELEDPSALTTPEYLSLSSARRPLADASDLTKRMTGAYDKLTRNVFVEITKNAR
jgi:hypothetical protein